LIVAGLVLFGILREFSFQYEYLAATFMCHGVFKVNWDLLHCFSLIAQLLDLSAWKMERKRLLRGLALFVR